ncbi:MAG: hypothetical protein KAI83_05880 [Thiomargarita sp.]|nr:hypothetical protein [Thiomargarita sp.]
MKWKPTINGTVGFAIALPTLLPSNFDRIRFFFKKTLAEIGFLKAETILVLDHQVFRFSRITTRIIYKKG